VCSCRYSSAYCVQLWAQHHVLCTAVGTAAVLCAAVGTAAAAVLCTAVDKAAAVLCATERAVGCTRLHLIGCYKWLRFSSDSPVHFCSNIREVRQVTERNSRDALQCWRPLRPASADICSRPLEGSTSRITAAALLFRDRRSVNL
jgi:hypothetical protein